MNRQEVIDKYFLLPDTPQSVLDELVLISEKIRNHQVSSAKDATIRKTMQEREKEIVNEWNKYKK